MSPCLRVLFACFLIASSAAWAQATPPRFAPAPEFGEQVHWQRLESGVRVFVNAKLSLSDKPRRLIVYATPNGNTIEQTFGCSMKAGRDWHFDIQHIGAQVCLLRTFDNECENILAIVQAPKLDWPVFRRDFAFSDSIVGELVESLMRDLRADRLAMAGHSGGGSFLFGWIKHHETLPAALEQVIFLDANYSYSDHEKHGDKLIEWLRQAKRRLIVIAYDDREIVLNGKKVVGPEGGTFRATERMRARLLRDMALAEWDLSPFHEARGLDGNVRLITHPNPENKILHTALVGDMNGLLHGLTAQTRLEERWGKFGGPRAYGQWISAEPIEEPTPLRASVAHDVPERRLPFPKRVANALTGSAFRDQIAKLSRTEREAAILREVTAGNVPDVARKLIPLRIEQDRRRPVVFVMPDYLAIGSNDDWFRVPISPSTACAIAEQVGATLITSKLSDDIWSAATAKLAPRPLTEERDSVATFWQHHEIIESQLREAPDRTLVAGIKKDVIWTNRLREKTHRVAIYGWHFPDGRPIQSVYVGHVDWYVDYSHGIRLMSREMLLDGQPVEVATALRDPNLAALFSSEGTLDIAALREASQW